MSLRIARKIAKLTQQELADRAGVDNSLISLVESGSRDLRSSGYDTVASIAEALGLMPDELIALVAACDPIVDARRKKKASGPDEARPA
jgi:transcriptional regulator with XRE-family HTH domain